MYIGFMFEVLVFVYENYWRGDACPELEQLGRKLSAAGLKSMTSNKLCRGSTG